MRIAITMTNASPPLLLLMTMTMMMITMMTRRRSRPTPWGSNPPPPTARPASNSYRTLARYARHPPPWGPKRHANNIYY